MTKKNCVVLFSGGIDSTTALYWAIDRFEKVNALTFDYGQRHSIEIAFSQKLTKKLDVAQYVFSLDLTQIGDSSLTDPSLPLPEFEAVDDIPDGPPQTYVPFRNGILLSLAAAWSEANNTTEIICGFNVIDSPNYPDTRMPFVSAMQNAVNQGTKAIFSNNKFTIHAPFVTLKKSEIVKLGLTLKADYSFSISCYSGSEIPCFKCSSCVLRKKAWEEAGADDHLLIRLHKEGRL